MRAILDYRSFDMNELLEILLLETKLFTAALKSGPNTPALKIHETEIEKITTEIRLRKAATKIYSQNAPNKGMV